MTADANLREVAVARLKILMGCDCGEDFNGRKRCISDA